MKRKMFMLLIPALLCAAQLALAQGALKDYTDVYLKARKALQYQALYEQSTVAPLFFAWMDIDMSRTASAALDYCAHPTNDSLKVLEALRTAYNGLKQIHQPKDVIIDPWEGHAALPHPGVDSDNSKETASLVDDPGFRPFLSDYRLPNPGSAKGTAILCPSIRGSYSELRDTASVLNRMGYNAFAIEPRFTRTEGQRWLLLMLDAQRAIRHVIYHAKELGIDPSKIITIGGSKGNAIHQAGIFYFDMTPTDIAKSLNLDVKDYAGDAIDQVPVAIKVAIVDYGSLSISQFGEFSKNSILNSRIYSAENYKNGFKYPAVILTSGNLDFDASNLAPIIKGMVEYNGLKDKLYTVNWEVHVLDGVTHGFGSGLHYPNMTKLWDEIDAFIMMNLKR
jgi:hypothetical protein